jgi:hypothetical protein
MVLAAAPAELLNACGRRNVAAARRETVIEWLPLLGWTVEITGRKGKLCGIATRRVGERTLSAEAWASDEEALGWELIRAATAQLEQLGHAVRAAAA